MAPQASGLPKVGREFMGTVSLGEVLVDWCFFGGLTVFWGLTADMEVSF
jgi:hypothetical protein